MAQTLLETAQHSLFIASVDVDDPVAGQARLRERRCKEVCARDTPQDLSSGARCNPCSEQRRCRALHSAVAASRNLVKRAQREPTGR